MKTCTFRYARPRTLQEGLFCLQMPEARYELAACGNCRLCYPPYDRTYRSRKTVLDFSPGHKHTFVNGYQAILNCSAVCRMICFFHFSSNITFLIIIYACFYFVLLSYSRVVQKILSIV